LPRVPILPKTKLPFLRVYLLLCSDKISFETALGLALHCSFNWGTEQWEAENVL